MGYYRLYFFDQDGHIDRCCELQADCDAEAIGAARQYRGRHKLELWNGARQVRTLKPLEPTPEAPPPQRRRLSLALGAEPRLPGRDQPG